jgi:glycosyltransferase involved in cell wall biosynthesis
LTAGVTHVLYLSEVSGRNPFSGAESHVLVLTEALAGLHADVELIAMLWDGRDYPAVNAKLEALRARGVKVVTVKRADARSRAGRWIAMLRSWFELRRLLADRQDRVIHLHLDLVFSVIVARLAGCRKIVVSVHNDEPFYATLRWRIWLRLVDRVVPRYVAITDHVRRHFQAVSGVRAEKLSTVYYGMAPPLAAVGPRERYEIAPDSFVVGFVGRLTAQKNLRVFIEAMERLPDVTAVIVGDGEDRKATEDLVARKGLRNVRLTGAVPNAAELMPMFDLFCLPSLWEGLGLVFIEAMLQRVPIAASRRGAIPEILGDGRFGLLFEPTREGIVQAVLAARANQSVMRQKADDAFAHATRTFTVGRMARETMAVYEAL